MSKSPTSLLIKKPDRLRTLLDQLRQKKLTIGFVPTMGALHEGHVSLVRRAAQQNDVVVVSIFVNPTQFGPKEDFIKYPRTLAADTRLLKQVKTRLIIFAPSVNDMYPRFNSNLNQASVTLEPSSPHRRGSRNFREDLDSRLRGNDDGGGILADKKLSSVLCGAYRPGHFDGVCTVVAKLFNMVGPCRAYFGEKDFQQLRIIEAMVDSLNFPIKVVRCPIVRESDGLAMSSRNRYLNLVERKVALVISRALRAARNAVRAKEQRAKHVRYIAQSFLNDEKDFHLQYLDIRNETDLTEVHRLNPKLRVRLFVAGYVGKTRLIDNAALY